MTVHAQDLITVAGYKALFPLEAEMSNTATIGLASAVNGDLVVVNGTAYTKAAATNAALRTFVNAAGLVACLSDPTYGIQFISAVAVSTNVTIKKAPSPFTIEVFGTITLSTDLDDYIQLMITSASLLMGLFCNRRLVDDTQAVTEYLQAPAENCLRLFLGTHPINTWTSVHEDADRAFDADTLLVEDDDYWIDKPRGILHKFSGSWDTAVGSVKVVYKGGLTSIPLDLQTACAWQTNWLIRNGSTEGVSRIIAGNQEEHRAGAIVGQAISPMVQNMLGAYRRACV